MSNSELKEILKRIADNDNTAFDDLYKNYSKVIFGIALSLLKNEENCNDIVQLVMSKLYTMSKEQFPTSHELTWLYTVTKNEALQFVRKEHPYVPFEDIIDMVSGTDELSRTVDMDTYRDMIKSLDEQSKAIVTLKVIAGFTHKEIGELLHIPTGTIQWKYHIAIHKLRIVLTNLSMFIISLSYTIWQYIKLQEPTAGAPEGVPISELPISFLIMCVVTGLLGAALMFVLKKRTKNPKK